MIYFLGSFILKRGEQNRSLVWNLSVSYFQSVKYNIIQFLLEVFNWQRYYFQIWMLSAKTGTHALYVHKHMHARAKMSFNCLPARPILHHFLLKEKKKTNNPKTITSHSRRCHTMSFPVPHTKAASLSAGTVLGAAATAVSSLHQQAKLPSNTDLLVGYRRCFSPEQTLLVPSLLCPLCAPLGFQFLSWVRFILPWQPRLRAAARTLFFSLILVFFPPSLSVFYSRGS